MEGHLKFIAIAALCLVLVTGKPGKDQAKRKVNLEKPLEKLQNSLDQLLLDIPNGQGLVQAIGNFQEALKKAKEQRASFKAALEEAKETLKKAQEEKQTATISTTAATTAQPTAGV